MKNMSGKDHRREQVRVVEDVVDRAPGDAQGDRRKLAAHVLATVVSERPARRAERGDRTADRDREGERQRLSVPARDDQAAHALDQVRDRVRVASRAEPVDLDEVPRQVDDEMVRKTKKSGKTPWTASPEPVRSASTRRCRRSRRDDRRAASSTREPAGPAREAGRRRRARQRRRRSPGRGRRRRAGRAARRRARSPAWASARGG